MIGQATSDGVGVVPPFAAGRRECGDHFGPKGEVA